MTLIRPLLGAQMLSAVLFFPTLTSAQDLLLPEVDTTTTVSSTVLKGGETFSVTVRVEGETTAQKAPVPAGVVFILDTSGSMQPTIGSLKSAAQVLLDKLDPNRDVVAAVAFSDGATVFATITSDITSVKSKIAGLGVGGFTNIAEGLRKGVSELQKITKPVRVAILFTDGKPEPNASAQTIDINNQLTALSDKALIVHTVGFGTVDAILLDAIARRTGGTFNLSPTASEIQGIFEKIYDEEALSLSTRAVLIKEAISKNFSIVDNSLKSSFLPSSLDPISFEEAMASVKGPFYTSGELPFPFIPELAGGNFFGYTFEARASDCDESTDQVVDLRRSIAAIEYFDGETTKKVGYDPIQITILKCNVHVDKMWDESERRFDITVSNSFGHAIRELRVVDELSDAFYVDTSKFLDFTLIPPPQIPNNDGLSIEWDIGRLESKSSQKLSYFVKENMNAVDGMNKIQATEGIDSAGVFWTSDTPLFKVLKSDAVFPALSEELIGYKPLSTATETYLESRMSALGLKGLGGQQIDLSGEVFELPNSATIPDGFFWRITYPPLEYVHWPVTSTSPPPEALYTGDILVRRTEDGYEFFGELSFRKHLPILSTSVDFVAEP